MPTVVVETNSYGMEFAVFKYLLRPIGDPDTPARVDYVHVSITTLSLYWCVFS